jgi:hypothetical protein
MNQKPAISSSTLRLGTLLLAGASTLPFAETTKAEPVQPFWVIPAVLSDAGLRPQAAADQKLSIYRPASPALVDLNLHSPARTETFWPQLQSLTTTGVGTEPAPFTVGLTNRDVELQPAVSSRINRLARGLNFSGGAMPAQVLGVDANIMDGRFRFSSDVIDDGAFLDQRDFRDPQLRETPREFRPRDATRRHRVGAQLIDSGNLKLMVDGEFGQISESFADNFRAFRDGDLVLPGSWSTVSSRLEFGSANVTVGFKDYETRSEARKREQVTLGFNKSELQIYRRQGSEFNLINGGQWLKKTSFSGISADLIVADVLPDAVADTLDPVRHLLPTSINGGFERGDVVRSEFTVGPRDKVSTANVAMTWQTRYGDTTASFWERRISTDLITPGIEEGRKLSASADRYVDVSHSMRHGDWKLGAGLSLIQTNDEVLGVSNDGSEYAPHVSVAYAPERGPKVELRFGAADAQSQLVDDNLAARAKTRQLQLSVDVSDYVRESLNRPEANLKLEYRYDFSNSGGAGSADPNGLKERDGGHALLVTFSTPLN